MVFNSRSVCQLQSAVREGSAPQIHSLLYIFCLVSVLTVHDSHAWQSLTTNLDINCSQTETRLLACSYRLLVPDPALEVSAQYNEQKLQIITSNTYPTSDAITAVLLLVDTSDPGRQDVIDRNISQIEQIVKLSEDHHRIGLASFDKDLNLLASPGSPRAEIISAARTLTAGGLTTELYFNTIQAIEILGKTNADRRVIFLFSDGQAEDTAYFHQDVVHAARVHGVVLNTLGFPRSVPLSVALQSLRRLSDETGGRFVGTDMNFILPDSFMDAPFDNIDRGGQFIVDLNNINTQNRTNALIEVRFTTIAGSLSVAIPVSLPVLPPVDSSENPIVVPTAPQVQFQAIPQPGANDTNKLQPWLWYGVPVVLILLVILSLLALLLLLRQNQSTPIGVSDKTLPGRMPAYLVNQDEHARCYPVSRDIWRIGRSRNNNMMLNESSVSRWHAEIRRRSNGKFYLYDLNSTNGVIVNNRKITQHKLDEGDVIEIGGIHLKFTRHPLNQAYPNNISMFKRRSTAA